MERDLHVSAPGWICHSFRMYLEEVGEEAERKMVDEALPQGLAILKGIISFDAAIFGCTSASAVYGKTGLARLHQTMQRTLGCPAYSAFAGIKDKIMAAGNPPLALLTPYTQDVNTFFIQTLDSFGISTVFQAGLGIVTDSEIAAVPPERILEFAKENREAIRSSQAGLALFSCTNLRALAVRAELENALGLPVITSNQCLVEWLQALPATGSGSAPGGE